VRAAWWHEKKDEVVDRSRCRVAAHDRILHVRIVVVHHKTIGLTKTGGSAGGDEIRARQEVSMLVNTWQDRRACVERTQTAAKACPCDEEEFYMTNLPLRGLYHNLSVRGSLVSCPAQRDIY
jgi:hypothetical protein